MSIREKNTRVASKWILKYTFMMNWVGCLRLSSLMTLRRILSGILRIKNGGRILLVGNTRSIMRKCMGIGKHLEVEI